MLGKAKIKSKCKGDDTSNVLILDTKKVRRVLANSIPVLSIFALVGIIGYALNITNLNLLVNSNKGAYAIEGNSDGTSAALIIDNGNIVDKISTTTGEVAYASHNVKINANEIDSYAVTITGPTKLNGSSSITGAGNKTPANMANNTWGYAWGADDAIETNLAYQSFTGAAQTLENSTATNNTVALSKKLAFAAKFGDNAEEGHYTATVGLSLTVTPKKVLGLELISNMQEMTSEICAASVLGDTKTLTDIRDSSTYTVAKLSDGNCWMTQNLHLAGGTPMTSSDTDLNGISSYTLPAATTGAFSNAQTNGTYENQQVRNSSDNDYGAYYSWCAATAGTCMTNSTTPVPANTDASSSICPKGWKLPKGGSSGDFQALYNLGHTKVGDFTSGSTTSGYWLGSDIANSSDVTFFWSAGFVGTSGLRNTGSYGRYWSRTASSATVAYDFDFASSSVSSADSDYRYFGVSVRCIAEKPQEYIYSISYKLKSGHTISAGSLPQSQTITSSGLIHEFTVPNTGLFVTGVNIENYLGDDGKVYKIGDTVTLTADKPSIVLTTNETGVYDI